MGFKFVHLSDRLHPVFRHPHTKRASALLLAILILGNTLLPALWSSEKVDAFSNLTQNNWENGIGTSPQDQFASSSNVVTSTPNQLTVDTSNGAYSDWCDTANCDTDWQHRQAISVFNTSGNTMTNYQVKLTIPYRSSMKNDFSDLRFLNSDSTEELSHFTFQKSDGQKATVFVKLPTIAGGTTNIKMYYGNGSANSTSNRQTTMEIADDWENNQPCRPGGTICTGGGVLNINNGEATWVAYNTGFGNNSPWDRSVDRVRQVDLKYDLSNFQCNQSPQSGGFMNIGLGRNSFQTSISAWKFETCDSEGLFWSFPNIYSNNTNYNEGGALSNKIRSNQWVTLRATALSSGGQLYEYSLDNGESFTEFNFYQRGTEMDETGFGISSGGPDAIYGSMRNFLGYQSSSGISSSFGIEETVGGYTGQLESVVYDLNATQTGLGNIRISKSGDGVASLSIRTGVESPGTADYTSCGVIYDGQPLGSTKCGSAVGQRYVQYMLTMAATSTADLTVTEVSFEYIIDTDAPTTNASNGIIKTSSSGTVITNGSWTRVSRPYVSWTAGADNDGGSGIAGYCIYAGTNGSADATTKGIITSASPLNLGNACEYITPNTNLDLSQVQTSSVDNGSTYYISIRAIDVTGNLHPDTLRIHYAVDNQAPQAMTLFTFPTAVNSSVLKVSWIQGLGNPPFVDDYSGIAGLKYCVTSVISGLSGCNASDNNWFGPNHGSGSISDTSDVFPASASELTTSLLDAPRLDEDILGYNAIVVAVLDNAGNFGVEGNGAPHIFQISRVASDAPANLQVTPASANANNFAFTWQRPVTLYGDRTEAEYCWSVNEPIAEDGSNCNWTGKNVYALAAGAYATQQGENTMYLATRDVTGNFDGSKFTSVTFTTSTVAPGLPHDLDISDVSIRATSTWKLALSWSAPEQTGAGVARYKVLRSTDDITYTEIGSTTGNNTSFIDGGLDPVLYYYKIQACDNANSCGIASTSANKKPTGRFTEPAKLTADTDQPKLRDVTTRKATILWYTDRESDSRIALGKTSGNYFTEEIGNSSQVSDHVINLTNLDPGTTYYYVAKWTDGDGNTGQSVEHTLRTLPAPAISEVDVSQLTISSGMVKLKTKDAAKVSLYYGKSEAFGDVTSIDTSSEESTYSIQLSGLSDGTKYYFKLNGYDIDGNEYQGNIYSFTTPARPVIANLAIDTVEGEPSSTKKVSWTTNVPTNSVVSYTPKDGQEVNTINSELSLTHEVIIKQLLDDTDYSLIARSSDSAGNTATSDARIFHTALDTRPPKISDVSIETTIRGNGTEAKGQIVVSWRTDEPATSQLAYGQGESSGFTSRTPRDDRLTTEHTMIISDLATASIYRVEVVSEDKAGNSVLSQPETAIIGRPSDNVFTIILTALQNVFGVNR